MTLVSLQILTPRPCRHHSSNFIFGGGGRRWETWVTALWYSHNRATQNIPALIPVPPTLLTVDTIKMLLLWKRVSHPWPKGWTMYVLCAEIGKVYNTWSSHAAVGLLSLKYLFKLKLWGRIWRRLSKTHPMFIYFNVIHQSATSSELAFGSSLSSSPWC